MRLIRFFTGGIGICLILLLTCSGVMGQALDERPNILWIVSEDNTSSFIGAYGNPYAHTPNIDALAKRSILYENAYCTAPVCAPSRATLISGMYPTSLGADNMRSDAIVPAFVQFFPKYLRQAGYYTSNNAKTGYNIVEQPGTWDESSKKATYKNRQPGQPFFAVFNIETSHESSIFPSGTTIRAFWNSKPGAAPEMLRFPDQPPLVHHPDSIPLPPYHPPTPEMKHDWALYYDKVTQMDQTVGALLKELEESGLADNTIVFYYADNGGVLGRSKRFVFENGLHVPLIVHIPEKYKKYAPLAPGARSEQLIDFTDFPATVLSLAGIKPPGYYEGRAFLGEYAARQPREKVWGFRGRMDESIDLVRSVRKGQYRYIKHYMPHRKYGQYVAFLWLAANVRSWESAYYAGTLNEVQSRFFKEKPAEELYDAIADPHNVNNLAELKEYQALLQALRGETQQFIVDSKDVGFIPEQERAEITRTTTLYEFARSGRYNLEEILETANEAAARDKKYLKNLTIRSASADPLIRYWAATGLLALGKEAQPSLKSLRQLLKDDKTYIATVAAEALYQLGYKKEALSQLYKAILHDNNITRLQALNALQLVDVHELKPIEKELTQIAGLNSEYDNNMANYLLKKIK